MKAPNPTFVLLVLSIVLFMFGIHNVDNAWNMAIVNRDLNVTYVDTTMFGEEITTNQLYVSGMLNILLGFIVGLISANGLKIGEKDVRMVKPKDTSN